MKLTMKWLLACLVWGSLSLSGCSSDTDVSNDSADASDTSDATDASDASDTSDTSATDACDYDGFNAVLARATFEAEYDFASVEGLSGELQPYDILSLEFYGGDFGGPSGPGSFPIGSDNYADCGLCVLVYQGFEGNNIETYFYATEGGVEISTWDAEAGKISASLTNAKLVEVTINSDTYVSTPVSGGETWCISSITLDGQAAPADDSDASDVSDPSDESDASDPADPSDEADESDPTDINVGNTATSCGSPDQGLTPIDCTAEGDTNADCVFGNHCLCSDGFVCEDNDENFTSQECAPQVMCIPAESTTEGPDWSSRPAGQCAETSDCAEFPSGAQTCSPFPGGRCTGGCGTDDDCGENTECRFGACVETCTDDLDCHLGLRCSAGSCLQQNCVGGICPTSGYACNSSGRCVRSSCADDSQCANGFYCQAGYCVESYWSE